MCVCVYVYKIIEVFFRSSSIELYNIIVKIKSGQVRVGLRTINCKKTHFLHGSPDLFLFEYIFIISIVYLL